LKNNEASEILILPPYGHGGLKASMKIFVRHEVWRISKIEWIQGGIPLEGGGYRGAEPAYGRGGEWFIAYGKKLSEILYNKP